MGVDGNRTWLRESFRFVISRFLLVIVSLGISLLLCELVLRIFPIPNRFLLQELLEQQWEPDPELLLKLKPNLDVKIFGHPDFAYSLHTNELGLRDEAFDGVFEIAALGDSFTFGFGVEEEESWPAQLEMMGDFRVANLGWAGWSSAVYPTTLVRYAVPLQSRIWLWAFYVNDLSESAGATDFLASAETNYLERIRSDSALVMDLGFPYSLRIVQLLAALFNPELFVLPNSGDVEFNSDGLQMRIGNYPWMMSDPNDPEIQRGWQITENAILEAKQLADRHDATLVVIFVPSRENAYWPVIEGSLPDFDIQQLTDVEDKLAGICELNDVGYLNLVPGFRQQAEARQMLYFPLDGHWNPAGHSLAAEIIYGYLVAEGLLSE